MRTRRSLITPDPANEGSGISLPGAGTGGIHFSAQRADQQPDEITGTFGSRGCSRAAAVRCSPQVSPSLSAGGPQRGARGTAAPTPWMGACLLPLRGLTAPLGGQQAVVPISQRRKLRKQHPHSEDLRAPSAAPGPLGEGRGVDRESDPPCPALPNPAHWDVDAKPGQRTERLDGRP